MNDPNVLQSFNIPEEKWQSMLTGLGLQEKASIIEELLNDISLGELAYNDFPGVLASDFNVDYVDALKLYQNLYSDFFEPHLDELDQRHNEYLSKVIKGEVAKSSAKDIKVSILVEQYENFLKLPELGQITTQLTGGYESVELDEIKVSFYNAINEKNRIEFMTSTAKLFTTGRVKELFTNDERYVKFWRNRVLKDKGLDGVRKFDENPLRREQFGSFIRHVIEERFEIPTQDAVLWAVFFSSLAHRAGDTDYDRLAYGDLADQKFKWNI